MAKIAESHYPGDLGVEEAEEWMVILLEQYDGRAESREAFAQDVGHKSADSGSFNRKIADARKYGILKPRGTYEATELGFQLADPPSERAREEAIYEMLQNIDLLSDLTITLNGSKPSNRFWRVLTEVTDANSKEARNSANWIEKLYRQMIEVKNKLETENTQNNETEEESESKSNQANDVEEQERKREAPESGIFLVIENDEFRFEESNDMNIYIVQQILESKKEDANQSSLESWSTE